MNSVVLSARAISERVMHVGLGVHESPKRRRECTETSSYASRRMTAGKQLLGKAREGCGKDGPSARLCFVEGAPVVVSAQKTEQERHRVPNRNCHTQTCDIHSR